MMFWLKLKGWFREWFGSTPAADEWGFRCARPLGQGFCECGVGGCGSYDYNLLPVACPEAWNVRLCRDHCVSRTTNPKLIVLRIGVGPESEVHVPLCPTLARELSNALACWYVDAKGQPSAPGALPSFPQFVRGLEAMGEPEQGAQS